MTTARPTALPRLLLTTTLALLALLGGTACRSTVQIDVLRPATLPVPDEAETFLVHPFACESVGTTGDPTLGEELAHRWQKHLVRVVQTTPGRTIDPEAAQVEVHGRLNFSSELEPFTMVLPVPYTRDGQLQSFDILVHGNRRRLSGHLRLELEYEGRRLGSDGLKFEHTESWVDRRRALEAAQPELLEAGVNQDELDLWMVAARLVMNQIGNGQNNFTPLMETVNRKMEPRLRGALVPWMDRQVRWFVPEGSHKGQLKRGREWIDRASLEQAGKLFEGVLAELGSASEGAPLRSRICALNGLAIVRDAQGRVPEALELMNQAVQLDPEHEGSRNNRAALAERLEDYEKLQSTSAS